MQKWTCELAQINDAQSVTHMRVLQVLLWNFAMDLIELWDNHRKLSKKEKRTKNNAITKNQTNRVLKKEGKRWGREKRGKKIRGREGKEENNLTHIPPNLELQCAFLFFSSTSPSSLTLKLHTNDNKEKERGAKERSDDGTG